MAKETRLTAKGLATRQRIVDAAAALMLDRGVARTTTEDVQDAAKVSASQLYHYFGDKNELVMAVIDRQADVVLGVQHQGLDRLDSFEALVAWRDLIVGMLRESDCAGGCPLGSLASDLAETDPVARARLANSFTQWEGLLRSGLAAMCARGELRTDVDTDALALAMLASVQGGLLLSQVRRTSKPLEVAVDTSIAYLRTLTDQPATSPDHGTSSYLGS
ncbi:MAG TPA: TetR/AcrR family transcriptional regulator [Pseudonocardiaceae bacterium]|nr:TetR/AcrR family transcriptional regulator [Pseudonocardiaceae bacterium]